MAEGLRQQNLALLNANKDQPERLSRAMHEAREKGKQFVQMWFEPNGSLNVLPVDGEVVKMVQAAANRLSQDARRQARVTDPVDPWDMHTWPEGSF